jgi:cytochrome c oxidase subunit 2
MNDFLRKLLFLPDQGSSISSEIDGLHYFVIGVTIGGATLVALIALVFIYRHASVTSPGTPMRTPRVESPVWLKTLVSLFLLALFVGWWIIGFGQYMKATVAPAGAMEVYVVAKQWEWKFAYPGGQTSLTRLYVPANRPVKLLITSRDVIHSFYVPAFRLKMDAVPGRYTTLWFEAVHPGTFDVYCAEFCGSGHSIMRGEVVALRPEEYDAWLRGQNPLDVGGGASLAAVGERVAAAKGCLQCHSIDGTKRTGPTWRDLYGRFEMLSDKSRVFVDGAYVTESMMQPNAKIVDGFAPVMPSFQGKIEPGETAAIIEFMKSLSRSADVPPAGERSGDGPR